MLTLVEVYNSQGETLSLPLQDVSGGYVVEDIEGLDPVKAEIVSSPFAQIDGTQYQSSRRENRNIVLTVGIEPDYSTTSVRELRSQLYGFFMPKTYITFRFFIDGVHFVDISGRVESCEAPLFSNSPKVVVSVLCFDPDLVSPDTVLINGSTVASTNEITIPYSGTVETGIVFTLSVDRALTEFTIYSQQPGGDYQSLEFAAILSAGDVVKISTVSRAKGATLTRAGSTGSILYGVSPGSSWINLRRGDNQFRVLAEGAAIPYTVEYRARYGGL